MIDITFVIGHNICEHSGTKGCSGAREGAEKSGDKYISSIWR